MHPVRQHAHREVARAKADGTLVPQPCEECGDPRAIAHHDDYALPLRVRWLCFSHHRRWHARNDAANRGEDDPNQRFVTLRLPADLHDQLLELAKRNDRTLSAEARRAFRAHLKGAST